MSKGAVIAGVVVVVVVLVGGGALAMASTKPVIRPDLAPPPPPPAPPSLGQAIVSEGFDLYTEANKNPYVKTWTGGASAPSYALKYAVNPIIPAAIGIKNVAKKIFSSIF